MKETGSADRQGLVSAVDWIDYKGGKKKVLDFASFNQIITNFHWLPYS